MFHAAHFLYYRSNIVSGHITIIHPVSYTHLDVYKRQLYAQGYRKMVIINGHGGNTFKSIIRDLSLDYPDFLIASSEWFAFVPAKEYFDAVSYTHLVLPPYIRKQRETFPRAYEPW